MPIPALEAKLNDVRNDQEELRHGVNYEGDLLLDLTARVLTARAMLSARLSQTTTPSAVETNWNQYYNFFWAQAGALVQEKGEDAVRSC